MNVRIHGLLRRLGWARIARALVLATLLGTLTSVASADNTDQTNSGVKYAWGENVGWITARPTSEAYAPGGNGMQVTDNDVTGYLWGENIGWINLSCKNDASCAGTAGNWGVKNDGAGHLSGYAWAENAGWISFSCQNQATCGTANYGVTITNYGLTTRHSQSGLFAGYAWGENLGWISFNCSNDGSCGTVQFAVQTGAPDSDGDGYTDTQEVQLGKQPFSYCAIMRADITGDGVVNLLDLRQLALVFTQSTPPASARAQLNNPDDAHIDGLDLLVMASVYTEPVSLCP